jgi:hypothetical protein
MLIYLHRIYSDITTGSWYKEFAQHCAQVNSVPLPLDIYYDDWKVSNLNSVGGLYFTFATYPRQTHWQVKHKYLIALIPHGTKIQNVLPKFLEDVGLNTLSREVTFFDGKPHRILARIARIIADTPGVASFCETSGHAGGILAYILFKWFTILFFLYSQYVQFPHADFVLSQKASCLIFLMTIHTSHKQH